jgi:DNA repair exonuclease SbcCD ATPase subunit
VFGRDYTFRFEWDTKRGQSVAVPVVTLDGVDADPLDAHGGGLVDVVAFVLRVVVATHARPALRRFMVLDEPFRHLSAEHTDGVGYLLRRLAETTGWQFLVVTHQRELAAHADVAYVVRLHNGATVLEPVID